MTPPAPPASTGAAARRRAGRARRDVAVHAARARPAAPPAAGRDADVRAARRSRRRHRAGRGRVAEEGPQPAQVDRRARRRRPGRRLRGGGAVLLTGASGTPSVLAWTPDESVAYTELRLDLPGNQQAELAKVVSAFPGFDDQAAFPTKINEILDQLVGARVRRQAELHGRHRSRGSAASSASASGRSRPGPTPGSARFLALAASRTRPRPRAWAGGVLQETGATVDHRDLQRRHDHHHQARGRHQRHGRQGADRLRRDRPRARPRRRRLGQGRDRHRRQDRPNTNEQFQTASATLIGDRLAFAYADTEAIVDGRVRDGPVRRRACRSPRCRLLDDLYPAWIGVALKADNGALVSRRASRTSRSSGPARQRAVDAAVARPGRHRRARRRPGLRRRG